MFSEVFKDKTIGLVITAAGVKTVEINEQYDKCVDSFKNSIHSFDIQENTAVFLTFYLCKFSLFSYFLVCCTFECRSVTRGQAGEEKAYTLLLLGQENINPLWASADA